MPDSPYLLPPKVAQLTEATSTSLAKQIRVIPITTPLLADPISTAFVCAGSQDATPIVLLHGFDSSVFEFRRLLPLLTPHARVWAVDLLGFGFTERPTSLSFSPDEIRSHLYSFWQTAIGRPAIWVGASMGGAAAIDFVLAHPEAASRLVLLDSAGFAQGGAPVMVPPFDWIATQILRNSFVRDRISKLAYHDRTFASKDAAACAALHLECDGWRRSLIAFTKSGGYTQLADRIASLAVDTLIVWGDNDRILGTEDAEKFTHAIASSRLLWVPDCGHVPHLEQAAITARAIVETMP